MSNKKRNCYAVKIQLLALEPKIQKKKNYFKIIALDPSGDE